MTTNNLTAPVRVLGGALHGFAWYAMPDVVRSRRVRTLLKLGLVVVPLALQARTMMERPEGPGSDEPATPGSPGAPAGPGERGLEDESAFTMGVRTTTTARAAFMATLLVGMGAAGVLRSRTIFRRGERLRADGHRFAHTRGALVAAALQVALGVARQVFTARREGNPA